MLFFFQNFLCPVVIESEETNSAESSRSRMVVKKITTAKLIRASSAEVVNGNSSCEGKICIRSMV
jgi:hypothetical protein